MTLIVSPPRARRALAAGFFCALATACGDGPTPPPVQQPAGLTVVANATATDTVMAVLPQTLVVEVRDAGGRLAAGTEVRFEASQAPLPGGGGSVATAAFAAGTNNFQPVATATTDAQGRAAVQVRLGAVAGASSVAITVPALGFSGTATYTVNPGAPARVDVAPADTAVYVGSSYTLRMAVAAVDRFGNPIAGQAVSVTPGSAAVSVSGATVSAVSVGRTDVVVQAAGASRTVSVSVVPRGTLLAAGPDGIYMFEMDGSGMRRVVASDRATQPRWFPDGRTFVFAMEDGGGWFGRAKVSDLNGATRDLVQDRLAQLQSELWPHPSRDGQWVYFGGYNGNFSGYPYRVRADGTGTSLVPGYAVRGGVNEAYPSPSPQGDRLAYFSQGGGPNIVDVHVRSTGTGEVLVRDISGHTPEWSHGDSIAFLQTGWNTAGAIHLMASNGTGMRVVAGRPYRFGIDWSPDDRWIVAYADDTRRIELVEVATGRSIPLPFTENFTAPSWKP